MMNYMQGTTIQLIMNAFSAGFILWIIYKIGFKDGYKKGQADYMLHKKIIENSLDEIENKTKKCEKSI